MDGAAATDGRVGSGRPVGEVARLSGVTVRTLHHYDEIGLLRPSGRTAAGYRSYDDADLDRLQRVLGYRELGFGLDEIAALLDGDDDPVEHLKRQRELVLGRVGQLNRLLRTIDATMEAHAMGIKLTPQEMFEVFGDHDPTEFAEEARERWGESEVYRQSQRRTSRYAKADWVAIKAAGEGIERRLVELHTAGVPATDDAALDVVEAHRQHITRWFYDCSTAMHRGLAQMYLADPRFTAHYEQLAPGLAQYVHDAVQANADRQDAAG
jgi:DNA-binding transcriptional MerR regulator